MATISAREQYFNDNILPAIQKAGGDVEDARVRYLASFGETPSAVQTEAPKQEQGGFLEDLIGSAKEAGKGLLQTGANIVNTPSAVADAFASAGAWAGGKLGIGDGTYNPAPRVTLPEELRPQNTSTKVLAEIAPLVFGGGASAGAKAAGAGERVADIAKAADTAVRAFSNDGEKEDPKDYMDKAAQLKKDSPDEYKDVSVETLAGRLAEAVNTGNMTRQAVMALTLPVGATGGLARMAGLGSVASGGSELAGQAAESLASGTNQFNSADVGIQSALGALGGIVGRGVNKGVEAATAAKGTSRASREVARRVDEEVLNAATGGGNTATREAFQNAIRDAEGNVTLTPRQVLTQNTPMNILARGAEDRSINAAGLNSPYQRAYNTQQEGSALENVLRSMTPEGFTPQQLLRESAQGAEDAFRAQAKQSYEGALKTAQDALDSAGVNKLELPTTKESVQKMLDEDAALGNVNLNAETRRTLRQFGKADITDINGLDKWKRTLNEKAQKAARNGDTSSAAALRDASNSLKGEADSLVNGINPEVGNIYKQSDDFYSQFAGDFGKKSSVGKVANASDDELTRMFGGNGRVVSSKTAADVGNVLGKQAAAAPIEEVLAGGAPFTRLSNFTKGLEGTMLGDALAASRKSGAIDFRNLGRNMTRNEQVSQAAAKGVSQGSGATQGDALDILTGMQARSDAYRGTRNATNIMGRNQAAIEGVESPNKTLNALLYAAPAIEAAVTGGLSPISALAAGGRFLANRGVLDKAARIPQNAQRVIENAVDPRIAQEALNYNAARQAAMGTATGEDALSTAIRTQTRGQGEQEAPVSSPEAPTAPTGAKPWEKFAAPQNAPQGPWEKYAKPEGGSPKVAPWEKFSQKGEPEQKAQSTKKGAMKVSDRLYEGIVAAETGGEDNPWIRTKGMDSSSNLHSSAYGPAQITYSLAQDYLTRKPELFTDKERQYLEAFVTQGQLMIGASNGYSNDPALNYGGEGYLNSPVAKTLYKNVAKKMLLDIYKRNDGDLASTVREWRGLDDPAYLNKVVKNIP